MDRMREGARDARSALFVLHGIRVLAAVVALGAVVAAGCGCAREEPRATETGKGSGVARLAGEIVLKPPWKSAFLEAELSSGKLPYGGRSLGGTYTAWSYRRTLVLAGEGSEKRVHLVQVFQGSEREFDRGEIGAKWTLERSPDGTSVAILREGAATAEYVALGPEPIFCPCMSQALEGGEFPFDKAASARALVELHLDPARRSARHPDDVPAPVMRRIRDYVSARPADGELGLLFARAALRAELRLGMLEDDPSIPAYQRAAAAREDVQREYRKFLENRGTAWTHAADNAVVALERCADETTQLAMFGHWSVPFERRPLEETRIEGNFHRHAARALARITSARKAAPAEIERALVGVFQSGDAYDRLYAIHALVALDSAEGWKAIEAAAGSMAGSPAWPSDFDAYVAALAGAPHDEAAVRRWAASALAKR